MRHLDRRLHRGTRMLLLKSTRNTVVPPRYKVVDLVERILHPLVVADEDPARCIDRQSGRITKRMPHRFHSPVPRNPQHLPPPATRLLHPTLLRVIAAQPDIQIAAVVPDNPAGPVVIVVAVPPATGHHLTPIGSTVPISVSQPNDFRLVSHNQVVAVSDDAIRCRQPLLEQAQRVLQPVTVALLTTLLGQRDPRLTISRPNRPVRELPGTDMGTPQSCRS